MSSEVQMSLSLDFTFERIPSLYSVVLFMMNHFLVYTDNQYLCVCSVICLHCMPVCEMLHGPGQRVLSRAVESVSLKVGKSLKIGKNRIKSEKSDLISYPTFWQKCQNAINCHKMPKCLHFGSGSCIRIS